MARVARERSKTGIYHVMLRGINRQTIFEDNQDQMRFLDTLEQYKNICEFIFYGYCLMNNHVHLLVCIHSVYGVRHMYWNYEKATYSCK